MSKVNQATIELIKSFESIHDGDLSRIGLQPKLDCAGIWTIGYGRALTWGNGHFLKGEEGKKEAYRQYDTLTEKQAEEMLRSDLNYFADSVSKKLLRIPTENQFGAMVSLAYNIGITAFSKSRALYYFNQGLFVQAADAFLSWNKGTVNGKKVILTGLVRRRQAERLLFLHD